MAETYPAKLSALRATFKKHGVQGFVVPTADEFQGEYVPGAARRLEWLTGFNGSNGMAIVLSAKAGFFTDGRYTLQAETQVPKEFEKYNMGATTPQSWAAKHKATIGYDPRLFTVSQLKRWLDAGVTLKAVPNLIDALWKNRPAYPKDAAYSYPLKYAGESSEKKITRVVKKLAGKADALLVAAPDSLCWLLNIRGNDVPHTPFLNANAIVDAKGKVTLFVEKHKVSAGLANQCHVVSPNKVGEALKTFAGKKIALDAGQASAWWASELKKAKAQIVEITDPIQHMKACKNEVEIAGIVAAHERDGAALSSFLCWLSANWNKGHTEITVSEKLASFRKAQNLFKDLSFGTIAGMGPNGAIVHYHAMPKTARKLTAGMFLLDSGGQYWDGTTDVTRTMVFGNATKEQKADFTRVLKGHIALATARFPKGITGAELDALARMPLWLNGQDYDHGTGHGVGCFLSVHEGPQRISRVYNGVALEPGMIVSNEPGYYKAGAYGIRIENLVRVVEKKQKGDEKLFYGFETLTLAPIDRNLIEKSLLTSAELAWLNAYHARVLKTLKVDAKTKAWLKKACAKI